MHVTCPFRWKFLQGAWKLEPNQELRGVTCGEGSSEWFDQEQICLLMLILGDIAATCKECLGFTRSHLVPESRITWSDKSWNQVASDVRCVAQSSCVRSENAETLGKHCPDWSRPCSWLCCATLLEESRLHQQGCMMLHEQVPFKNPSFDFFWGWWLDGLASFTHLFLVSIATRSREAELRSCEIL